MPDKHNQKRKDGARRIKAHLQELAQKQDIKVHAMALEPPIFKKVDSYLLIVCTNRGDTKVTFSRKEIEDYPEGASNEETDAKIQGMLVQWK